MFQEYRDATEGGYRPVFVVEVKNVSSVKLGVREISAVSPVLISSVMLTTTNLGLPSQSLYLQVNTLVSPCTR